jgi:hypothetical protein
VDGVWSITAMLAWLNTLGLIDSRAQQLRLVDGTQPVPKMVDELAIVTPVSGPGESLEGLADAGDVSAVARDSDRKIRFADFPTTVSNVQLITVRRAGSPPAPLTGAPDPGERTEYVCTYLTTVMEAMP